MNRAACWTAWMLWLASAAAAQADDRWPRVEWKCVQERDASFHVTCVARPLPGDPATLELLLSDVTWPDTAAETPPMKPAEPPPRGQDLRPVAARGAAAVFSAEPWRLPLYARPSHPANVNRLLTRVLCGSAPHCTVTYSP